MPRHASHSRLTLPVSSCEQCGETTGLKLITLKDRQGAKERQEWHCFECRRRHAVHSDKNAGASSVGKGQAAHA